MASGESGGIDIDQHGISAYPEYVISALTAPLGMGPETIGSGNLPQAPGRKGGIHSGELVMSK